jgi:hypothetical protein
MRPVERRTKPAETEADPWRYGERHVPHVGPDGEEWFETVPLKEEDLLFPEEGDRPVITKAHNDTCSYLDSVLEPRVQKLPHLLLLRDHRVDFEVRGIAPLGPDLSLFEFDGDWDTYRGTFPVVTMKARCLLAVEVTSWDSRRFDLGIKCDLYFRCGVSFYAIVDLFAGRTHREVRILAYQAGKDGYVAVEPDARGLIELPKVGVKLGVIDNHAACFDLRGRLIASDSDRAAAKSAALRKAERRIAELEAQLRKSRRQK